MDKQALLAKLKNSTRTKEEYFESITLQMKELSKGKFTDDEAVQAANNLIRFCTLIVDGQLAKQQKLKAKTMTGSEIKNDSSKKIRT